MLSTDAAPPRVARKQRFTGDGQQPFPTTDLPNLQVELGSATCPINSGQCIPASVKVAMHRSR